jgi:hypothetical protein
MQSFVVLTKPQRWKKYIYMMYIISNPALGEGEYWYIIRKNIHNEGGFSMFSPTKKSPSKTNFNGNDMHLSQLMFGKPSRHRKMDCWTKEVGQGKNREATTPT